MKLSIKVSGYKPLNDLDIEDMQMRPGFASIVLRGLADEIDRAEAIRTATLKVTNT